MCERAGTERGANPDRTAASAHRRGSPNPQKASLLDTTRLNSGREIDHGQQSQERASGAEVPNFGRGRGFPLGVSAALVGSVLLVYCVPFFGFLISFAVLIALVVMRRDLWGAAGPRIALLAVLVWVGLWLPAITYIPTAWYLTLTGRELSTSWLALPLWAPSPIAAGTLVPALAAAVVFAVGLTVSAIVDRPWLVVLGAWLAPWAHQLAFTRVTAMG
jgi:hypothetical protein